MLLSQLLLMLGPLLPAIQGCVVMVTSYTQRPKLKEHVQHLAPCRVRYA